eukprot:CAMPEP_0170090452 /NCGR_PEP_ID=MMETSP0019_2-20121128/24309_1 /TAXON_ID=98059 /ORGANISM="Dinobryon sp., Strain UTEXLB2267" /LENGTH=36 /DNA_ID= /DNA_START= /DNA_END= /DNA_ORIENTATION=
MILIQPNDTYEFNMDPFFITGSSVNVAYYSDKIDSV